jgi:hypothetical protein
VGPVHENEQEAVIKRQFGTYPQVFNPNPITIGFRFFISPLHPYLCGLKSRVVLLKIKMLLYWGRKAQPGRSANKKQD